MVNNIYYLDLATDEEQQKLKIRRKLLELAYNPKTVIDLSNLNTSLIHFLHFAKIDPAEFIRNYLKQIQPFMITLDKDRSRKADNFSCIIDASYSVPLWIEVNTTQFKETVISFHEVNWYNVKYDNYWKSAKELLCIALDANKVKVGEKSIFKIQLLKGFLSFELSVPGVRVDDNFIRVKKERYESALLQECNLMLDDVLEEFTESPVLFPEFTNTKQVSFTSYGDRLENSVSLLFDLFSRQPKNSQLSFVLAVKLQELQQLPDSDVIIDQLLEKFKTYKKIDLIPLLEVNNDI